MSMIDPYANAAPEVGTQPIADSDISHIFEGGHAAGVVRSSSRPVVATPPAVQVQVLAMPRGSAALREFRVPPGATETALAKFANPATVQQLEALGATVSGTTLSSLGIGPSAENSSGLVQALPAPSAQALS